LTPQSKIRKKKTQCEYGWGGGYLTRVSGRWKKVGPEMPRGQVTQAPRRSGAGGMGREKVLTAWWERSSERPQISKEIEMKAKIHQLAHGKKEECGPIVLGGRKKKRNKQVEGRKEKVEAKSTDTAGGGPFRSGNAWWMNIMSMTNGAPRGKEGNYKKGPLGRGADSGGEKEKKNRLLAHPWAVAMLATG